MSFGRVAKLAFNAWALWACATTSMQSAIFAARLWSMSGAVHEVSRCLWIGAGCCAVLSCGSVFGVLTALYPRLGEA